VSHILGDASVTTTLDVYSHLFDEARHGAEIRARMGASAFAQLLTHEDAAATVANGKVLALRAGALDSLDWRRSKLARPVSTNGKQPISSDFRWS
jgi:hypothetical protein